MSDNAHSETVHFDKLKIARIMGLVGDAIRRAGDISTHERITALGIMFFTEQELNGVWIDVSEAAAGVLEELQLIIKEKECSAETCAMHGEPFAPVPGKAEFTD